jgi:HD-GYP domain-containing protein (c-di-GMP phosphodiesterase class II)
MADREEAEILRNAKDIINHLAVVIRTSQIHNPGNVTVLKAIDRFVSTVNPLLTMLHTTHQPLVLELIGEFFYLNDMRVRLPMEYLLNFNFLIREFRKKGLGRITLQRAVTSGDIKKFLEVFIASSFSQEPFNILSEGMAQSDFIRVGPLRKFSEEGCGDIKRFVKKTYFNAVSFSKGVINKIKSGEKISLRKAKRVVESMVDMILGEEELLLGMTAIKDYDQYTYHHSVNVSILSIALGQRLGLNRKALTELGLVALFHDIGKIEVPAEILNKTTNFTEEEWRVIKRHPFWGVHAILKLKGIDVTSTRTAIVAFEHHLNYNLTGYPSVSRRFEINFYSKIVSLADQYDAITSSRVYSRVPMPPDKALSVMAEKAGSELDPLLFKFFINMIGVFPTGTLVLLDTRELGLVHGSNSTFYDRPRVMIIVDSRGNRVNGNLVDLTEKDASGMYVRSIIKTLDPNKYRISLAEYLM